jgi:hypothetical protein
MTVFELKRSFSDILGAALVIAATAIVLWLLSIVQWRDRHGDVHYDSCFSPAYLNCPNPRQPYWYDEIGQGPFPGSTDYP